MKKFAVFYSKKGVVEIEAETEDEAEEKFYELGDLDLDENENLEVDDIQPPPAGGER